MKLDRSAFLYLDPLPPDEEFAQCSTCSMWVQGDDRCVIHGPHVPVPGTASCGLYINGDPQNPGTDTEDIVTTEESGLVDREVRCENCKWGGPKVYDCELFDILNTTMPDIFDLNTEINPKGCCNAQQPRED